MKALQTYIDKQNQWNAIFKGSQYEIKTAKGRQEVANRIDSDLSPENLTCDGELPASQVRERVRYLSRCAEELLSIDPSVSFSEMGV